MKFSSWLDIREGVVINDMGTEANLVIVEPALIREFNYQFERGYSTFFVAPLQAQRTGYISMSSRPTHVGITKTTPIEAGMGTDIAFLKNLTALLQQKGYKAEPYKEGGSDWGDLLRNAPDFDGKDDLMRTMSRPADQQSRQAEVPSFQQGATNMTKVTPGISVSRMSGSWSYYIRMRGDYADHYIRGLLDLMKQAVKPLLDADVVDFYEVVERKTGKRLEVAYSKKGQADADDWRNQYRRAVAQIKFLAEVMLKNHPKSRKWVLDRVNHVGVRIIGGGTKHPEEDVQPANARVPIDELLSIVKQSYADDFLLGFFLRAVKKDDTERYRMMETAAGLGEKAGSVLYMTHQLVDEEGRDILGDGSDRILSGELNLYDALKMFREHKALETICPAQFREFHARFQEEFDRQLPEILQNLRKNQVKTLKELADYIDIPPEVLAQLDQAAAKFDDEDRAEKQRQAEAARKRKLVIYEGDTKYLVVQNGDKEWEKVPSDYVSYHGDVEVGRFCLDHVVDREDVAEQAYEIAMEKAQDNIQERPSETYGEDDEEVDGDIGYDWDDFVNDMAFTDVEDRSDDEIIQAIKDRFRDEFVKWKKEKMREDEDSESWKYEVEEPENQDVWDAEEELAEEAAWSERGLVIIKGLERNDLEVEMESKFFKQLLPVMLETLRVMSKEKDPEFDERIIKGYTKVTFAFRDKQGVYYTVNDFLEKHGRQQ